MIKKLSKHGNSLAIILDKAILTLLNIDEKTKIKIRTDGNNIILEPIKTEGKRGTFEDKKLKKIYEKLVEKYKDDLEKLANVEEASHEKFNF